jgi:hypothetical protein
VNFLFYAKHVPIADKATSSGIKCRTQHYSLWAAKSISFSHHKTVFQQAYLPTWISRYSDRYVASHYTREGANMLPVYRHSLIA